MIWNSKTLVGLAGLAGLIGVAFGAPTPKSGSTVQSNASAQKLLSQSNGPTGGGFVENKGQWDPQALYYSAGPMVDTWVTKSGVRYDFYDYRNTPAGLARSGHVVDMEFKGSTGQPVALSGPDLHRPTNYIGSGAHYTAGSYSTATLKNLYPGIDLALSKENGSPRFDLIVGAGRDPSQIRVHYRGADGISQHQDGTIVLNTAVGEKEVADLHAFQNVGGKQKPVRCNFDVHSDGTIGFRVGAHDLSKPLTIDPIIYSTLLGDDGGGNHGTQAYGVYVGPDSQAVITGYTEEAGFPTTLGAYNNSPGSGNSVFVTKFNNDGSGIVYSTIINSFGTAIGLNVAEDQNGRIFVSGLAEVGYVTTPGAYQTTFSSGIYDQFLSILTPNGASLAMSTYYGSGFGNTKTEPLFQDRYISEVGGRVVTQDPRFYTDGYIGMNVDGSGKCYLIGKGNIKASANAYQTANVAGGDSTYVACFTNAGTFSWASYFTAPGTTTNTGFVNADGSIYFGGNTNGGLAATKGAFATTVRGLDGFVTMFQPVTGPTSPMKMAFTTYIGGSGNDDIYEITADSLGEPYVVGRSGSVDLPTTPGCFNKGDGYGGNFLAKFTLDGSSLQYCTYMGAWGNTITSIAVDTFGNAYVTGSINTDVPTFGLSATGNADQGSMVAFNFTEGPTGNPPTPYTAGDVYLQVMNSSGTGLVYSGFFGGTYDEQGEQVALDPGSNAYLVGWTDSFGTSAPASTEYPVTGGAFDGAYTRFPLNPAATAPWYMPPQAFLTKVRAIDAPYLTGLQIPSVLAGGAPAQISFGVISINQAQNTDFTVALTSSDPSIASVPDSATITRTFLSDAPGQQPVNGITPDGPFPITTTDLTVQRYVTITASHEGIFLNRTVVVTPWLQSFSVAIAKIVGGNITTARAYLSVPTPPPPPNQPPAPYLTLKVLSSDPTKATAIGGDAGAPNQFYIYTSSNNVIIPIQTFGVDDESTVTLSAEIIGPVQLANVVSSQLVIEPAHVSAIHFTPDVVVGGNVSNGVVSLNGAVGPTPRQVTLAESKGTATVTLSPTQITIPAQANSGNFQVTTPLVQANRYATVTATENVSGAQASGTIYLQPTPLASITLANSVVVGGSSTTAYVTLGVAAPPTGVTISVSSPNSFIHFQQSYVTVPPGQTVSNSVTVSTSVTQQTLNGQVMASNGQYSTSSALTVLPQTMSLSVTPNKVIGGQQGIKGTVTLGTAVNKPFYVALSSSNSNVLVLNSSKLYFAANAASASFSGFTTSVNAPVNVTVTASLTSVQGAITSSATVTVNPIPFVLNVTPNPLVGGVQNGSGTVTLAANAKSNTTVQLASNNAAAASVPSSVVVPAGSNVGNFTVVTHAVSSNVTVTLTGTDAQGSNTTTITVLPPNIQLQSLTIAQPSGFGGYSTTGTVKTSGQVPVGGVQISLKSSNTAAVQVPATTTLAHGATSSTFSITTSGVASDTTVTITASFKGSSSVSATMLILAPRTGTIKVSPSEVIGGQNSTMTLAINFKAPSGGLAVTVSNSPYIAGITVGGKTMPNGGSITLIIPAGTSSANFTITTPAVSRQLGTTFTATFGPGGNSDSAALLLDPQQ